MPFTLSKTRHYKSVLAASCAVFALSMAAGAHAQSTDSDLPAEEGEIIVRGVKQSLKSSRDTKRSADQILDAIDAQDIGKLPDTNVAESLQRITGVQINRELGEGSELSVRGFSQNRIEINGQTQIGSGAGGGVSFQTLPSEAFSSLEVVKTPSADDVEGGIGATIRLKTRKPLDNRKLIIAGGLSGQYADRADEWAPQGNLLLSNAWDTKHGEIGLSLNLTRSDRKLRQDFLDVRGWDAVNGFGRDLDGDGVVGEPIEVADGIITDLQDGAFVPLQTRLRIRNQDRKLQSLTTAFQWRPADNFEIYSDLTYSDSKANDKQFQYTASLNSAIQNDPNNPGSRIRGIYQVPEDAVISNDRTVLSAFLGEIRSNNGRAQRGVNFNISGNSAPNEQEVYTWDVGAKYEFDNGLKAEVNYAEGHGESFNEQIFTTSSVDTAERPFYFFDFGNDADVPTLIPVVREIDGQGTTGVTPESRVNLLDLNTYNLGTPLFQNIYQSNTDKSFKVDFDKEVDFGIVKEIEFGLRWGYQQGERFRLRADDDETNGGISDLTFTELEALYPGIIVQQPFDDVLNGATGDFPRDWFSINPTFLRENSTALRAAAGISQGVRDLGWEYNVNRDTMAYYLKANFEGTLPFGGMSYSGNVGGRYIETTADIFGFTDNGETVEPIRAQKSYTNFLPSGNLALVLTDNTFLRFGAAKTIARPDLDDLAPVRRVQFFADAGNGGNPALTPERVTQFDVSFERYFGDANLISMAYFYKDFSERIEDGVLPECIRLPLSNNDDSPGDDGCAVGENLIRLSVPDNVGSAKVHGIELGYQQTFDFLPSPLDGFGLIANYTYIDIDGGGSISATGLPLPVQDLSENSYNLVAFYEKYGFQARAAYNWRDEFYDERTSTNQASFAEPYGQLDISASYDVSKNLTLTFEGLNILNEEEIRYQEIRERLIAYRVNDTRFVGGLRFRF